ncbi:hypothetical protein C8R41DRAFT_827236 [Lentinula lateritia]|uniref:Secreted protein n=1 Tax=Lentinula lateritia TaxID=40482 RepID=A0ABQ8VLN4_9AGAR|nr:hypothetical protein C8R41DRAFT_827236 [Lentinula lateritia]
MVPVLLVPYTLLIPCSTCLGSVLALAVPTNEPCVHRRDADISTLGCPCRRLDTKDIKGREGCVQNFRCVEAWR